MSLRSWEKFCGTGRHRNSLCQYWGECNINSNNEAVDDAFAQFVHNFFYCVARILMCGGLSRNTQRSYLYGSVTRLQNQQQVDYMILLIYDDELISSNLLELL